MLKRIGSSIPLLLVVLVGCTMFSKSVMPLRVHDIHINGQNSINPAELYAVVGEEIRWHNDLSAPIHLGFLSVQSMQEAGCERGFKTWYGAMKDIVRIPAGTYVSLCFLQSRMVQYNIWTDIADPVHSMSPTAVIHLDEAA
ncbi:MAG: hypothetical protein OJF50_004032 [Nitrospira sp.]|nr:hypothetical protein [Nitrospira sp.]